MKKWFFIYVITLFSTITFAQNKDLQNINQLSLTDVTKDSISMNSEKYQLSNWGYGVDLLTGYNIFTEGLHNHFKNQVLFGMSFTMQYKKIIVINLGYVYGCSKTKKDIEIDSLIWKKGSKARYHNLELSMAYPFINNNTIRVLPFMGLSISGILAKDLSPNADYIFDFEKDEIEEKFNFYDEPFFLGLCLDIKFRNGGGNDKKNKFAYLRVKYAYNLSHYNKDYNEFKGNNHNIILGFGGFMRKSL